MAADSIDTSRRDTGFTYSGDELDAMAGARNYYRWIAESFAPHLGPRIVEVGAGIGTFAEHLLAVAPRSELLLVEPAENNFPHLRSRFSENPRVRVLQGYLDGSFPPASADALVAVNVMEHVRDDGAFLRDAARSLVPGGRVLIFVPALPAIYGAMDEAFEHFRRYTRPVLRERLLEAGFRVDVLRYVNLPGVAAWWLTGRVLRRRTVTPASARLYDRWVIPWVRAVERRWSPPLGQSLLAVGVREAGSA